MGGGVGGVECGHIDDYKGAVDIKEELDYEWSIQCYTGNTKIPRLDSGLERDSMIGLRLVHSSKCFIISA